MLYALMERPTPGYYEVSFQSDRVIGHLFIPPTAAMAYVEPGATVIDLLKHPTWGFLSLEEGLEEDKAHHLASFPAFAKPLAPGCLLCELAPAVCIGEGAAKRAISAKGIELIFYIKGDSPSFGPSIVFRVRPIGAKSAASPSPRTAAAEPHPDAT